MPLNTLTPLSTTPCTLPALVSTTGDAPVDPFGVTQAVAAAAPDSIRKPLLL
jgi:hypothetical protein